MLCVQDCFGYFGLLCLHRIFWIAFPMSVKNDIDIFDWSFFTVLILSIHEHGSLLISVASLVS